MSGLEPTIIRVFRISDVGFRLEGPGVYRVIACREFGDFLKSWVIRGLQLRALLNPKGPRTQRIGF